MSFGITVIFNTKAFFMDSEKIFLNLKLSLTKDSIRFNIFFQKKLSKLFCGVNYSPLLAFRNGDIAKQV
jgi:hypothetical protein